MAIINHQRRGMRRLIYGAAAAVAGLILLLLGGPALFVVGLATGLVALIAAMDKSWGLTVGMAAVSVIAFLGWADASFLGRLVDWLVGAAGVVGLVGGGITAFLGWREYKGRKAISSR